MTDKKKMTKEEWKSGCIGMIVIALILFFVARSCFNNDESSEKTQALSKEELRIQEIESCFSAWDGSHSNVVKFVLREMNDPNSFEHIETKYVDRDSVLWITMDFTGKNAYGGRVRHKITSEVDIQCNYIETLYFE